MVKSIAHIKQLLFTAALCLPIVMSSQDTAELPDNFSFFKEQARKDAKHEQLLSLSHIEDEMDYWKDQRNFEKSLKKISYNGYQAYVNAKWAAYSEHEEHCTDECSHGAYYLAQASFYSRYGEKDNSPEITSISQTTVQKDKALVVKEELPQ